MTEADYDKQDALPPEGDENSELSLTALSPDELLSRYIAAIVERGLVTVRAEGGHAKEQLELIRRVLAAVSGAGGAILPPEDDPDRAPWTAPDVLVGSVRSEAQYAHCLRRGYYYVPATYILRDDPPVRYVAMCHAAYTADPGIRWYGEVLRTARVPRRTIPFPLTRNNPDEWYYAYVVKSWKPLETAVAIRDGSVYQPRRTNSFLLTHAPYTCALFDIRSATEYRVFMQLYRHFCTTSGIEAAAVCPDGRLSLSCTDTNATLTDRAGQMLYSVTADGFRQSPGQVIRDIAVILAE